MSDVIIMDYVSLYPNAIHNMSKSSIRKWKIKKILKNIIDEKYRGS
jgi:hypothetical protein